VKKLVDSDLITGDEIEFRTDDKKLITLPKGTKYSELMRILEAKKQEQETVADFTRVFNYRPYDGAVATAIVLKARYGLVMGKTLTIQTPFGEQKRPPQVLEVPIGPGGKSMQAPWGCIEIPVIEGGEVHLGATTHSDFGSVFFIRIRAKRMYAKEAEEFFAEIAEQLKNASIYRGKAVAGADELAFIEDLDKFDPKQIVFAAGIQQQLEAALYSPLRHPQAYRSEKIPLKRAVLLHGPYGTGKTSIGMLVAQEAVKAGWTFVMARPGRDRVQDVLTTARLYAPAVVWVEDIDTDTGSSNPKSISEMLDAFDGITTKQGEIMIALSTNHIDRVPPGMLRPGRLDYVLEIAALDREATERLIRVVVAPGKLAKNVDFDAVYAEMDHFLPAFVRATADRARSFAIHRTNGRTDYVLTTEDLVGAARSLHSQRALHQSAQDPAPLPSVDKAFRDAVTKAVNGVQMLDDDGDYMGKLTVPAAPVARPLRT
jgi:transitional endoplasmic reticulum ATPase